MFFIFFFVICCQLELILLWILFEAMLIAISSFSFIVEFLWCMLEFLNWIFYFNFWCIFVYVLLVLLYLITLTWNQTHNIIWTRFGNSKEVYSWCDRLGVCLVCWHDFELLWVESVLKAHDCLTRRWYMLECICCASTDFNLSLHIQNLIHFLAIWLFYFWFANWFGPWDDYMLWLKKMRSWGIKVVIVTLEKERIHIC